MQPIILAVLLAFFHSDPDSKNPDRTTTATLKVTVEVLDRYQVSEIKPPPSPAPYNNSDTPSDRYTRFLLIVSHESEMIISSTHLYLVEDIDYAWNTTSLHTRVTGEDGAVKLKLMNSDFLFYTGGKKPSAKKILTIQYL